MSTAGIIRTAFDGVQAGSAPSSWSGRLVLADRRRRCRRAQRRPAGRRRLGRVPLRKWDFSGPDALAAADRIFTNDMLGLEVGQVRYAPFCDENGKMVGDGTVFKFTDSSAWVITALDSTSTTCEVVPG